MCNFPTAVTFLSTWWVINSDYALCRSSNVCICCEERTSLSTREEIVMWKVKARGGHENVMCTVQKIWETNAGNDAYIMTREIHPHRHTLNVQAENVNRFCISRPIQWYIQGLLPMTTAFISNKLSISLATSSEQCAVKIVLRSWFDVKMESVEHTAKRAYFPLLYDNNENVVLHSRFHHGEDRPLFD